jgi:hypothetical protein
VNGLLRRLYNAHDQVQGYSDDVVLLQKSKFISTLCDCMHRAQNCVKNWCREIVLSVKADNSTIVLFTNNRKIGSSYNPRLFVNELRTR